MKKPPTKNDIDAVVRYVADSPCRDGRWFSWHGTRYGSSYFDAINGGVYAGALEDAIDYAVKLGFLQQGWSGGSCGWITFRITKSGLDLAEGMR